MTTLAAIFLDKRSIVIIHLHSINRILISFVWTKSSQIILQAFDWNFTLRIFHKKNIKFSVIHPLSSVLYLFVLRKESWGHFIQQILCFTTMHSLSQPIYLYSKCILFLNLLSKAGVISSWHLTTCWCWYYDRTRKFNNWKKFSYSSAYPGETSPAVNDRF